mmetsp:Transcript_23593/g.62376  ORF Transcript_23593/g.62376 Transcript_23593/m.62376 type:complete len:208 (+) Transcript_23593:410-1033(+)
MLGVARLLLGQQRGAGDAPPCLAGRQLNPAVCRTVPRDGSVLQRDGAPVCRPLLLRLEYRRGYQVWQALTHVQGVGAHVSLQLCVSDHLLPAVAAAVAVARGSAESQPSHPLTCPLRASVARHVVRRCSDRELPCTTSCTQRGCTRSPPSDRHDLRSGDGTTRGAEACPAYRRAYSLHARFGLRKPLQGIPQVPEEGWRGRVDHHAG